MNEHQNAYIIASAEDGLHYNLVTRVWTDLDNLFKIASIQEITHDTEDDVFYILANSYKDKLGIFLI